MFKMNKDKFEESRKIIFQVKDMIKSSNLDEANFYFEKAYQCFETSQRLLQLIEEEDLNAHMWVINSSYYSMFFMVTALLAKKNKKIGGELGIHKLTYHAFICFFYEKIKQSYILDYEDAIGDSEQLLRFSEEKVENLVQDYNFEIRKRKVFTYHMGKKAEISKAKTSVNRAKNFLIEMERIFDSL